jgi:perosamine synthetase
MSKNIPLHAPKFIGNEKKYLNQCIKSSWLSSSGKFVNTFEKKISTFTKSKYAISCVNGTSALHLSLKLAGVKKNDEVIAPIITFIAAINVIKYLGANPIFMDCDNFLNLNINKTIEFIKFNTYFKKGYTYNKKTNKKISALIAVHVFGNPVDLEKIIPLCKKRNIKIIEDSSESLGSFYSRGKLKGKHTGTVGFLGCLSFNLNKIITTGGGGMILTNSKKLAIKAKYLSTQAKDDSIKFVHNSIGYNYGLTNIHAAIGLAQYENLKKIIKRKRKVYLEYKKKFLVNKNVVLMNSPSYSKSNFWINVIKVKNKGYFNFLLKKLLSNNIEVRPVWKCNHLQKPYIKCQKFKISNALNLVNRCICLPSSYFLSKKQIIKISKLINA